MPIARICATALLVRCLLGASAPAHLHSNHHDADEAANRLEASDLLPHPAVGRAASWNSTPSILAGLSENRLTAEKLDHHLLKVDDWVVPAGLEQVEEKMSVLCGMKETMWADDHSGNLRSMSQHDLVCGGKEFLASWRLERGSRSSEYKFIYKCCSLVEKVGNCVDETSPYRDSQGDSLLALGQLTPQCPGGKLMKGWKLLRSEQEVAFQTRCCGFYGQARVGKCVDSKTTVTTASRDVRRLAKHDIECKYGYALARWQMDQPTRSTFSISYTCCMAGDVIGVSMGESRTCRWAGDPHFLTFDGGRHETTQPSSGAAFWIVKSKDVNIQGFYQGHSPRSPASTVGVVVFGRFLQGHKLVIKKDVPRLREHGGGGAALLEIGNNASQDFVSKTFKSMVLFDDQQIHEGQFRREGLLQVTRHGKNVRASLPLGVELSITQHGFYQDAALTMGQPPGGQEGQCGNNNGNAGDDQDLMGSFAVPQEENMFLMLSPTQAGTAKKLSDCQGVMRDRAIDTCSHKFKGTRFFQDFLNMCIFDYCFTDEGLEFAASDKEAELEAQKGVAAQRPRRFLIVKEPQRAINAFEACKAPMESAKITSSDEQMGVMLAISELKECSRHVWTGGHFKDSKWVWHDGEPICGFENWEAETKHRLANPMHDHLCIDKHTGKWLTCPPSVWNHVACIDRKQYALQSFTGPLEARTTCGDSHQLAMPKTEAEQKNIMQIVKKWSVSSAFIWLGASFRNDRWEWDDGSKVCWTNWDLEEPRMANKNDEGQQLFLGMSAATGKWRVFTGYKTFHDVACEAKRVGLTCPLSRLNPSHLRLTANPTEMSSAVAGHCYYIGEGMETCHETCWRQMDGYCSEAGLRAAALSKGACKLAVAGFGGIGSKSQTSTAAGNMGCSYKDMGSQGGISMAEVVLAESVDGPNCHAKTTSPTHHRLCACKDDLLLTYPVNHVVTTGDTVRVCAMGWSHRSPFAVLLKGHSHVDRASLIEDAADSRSQQLQDWLQWAEALEEHKQQHRQNTARASFLESATQPSEGMRQNASASLGQAAAAGANPAPAALSQAALSWMDLREAKTSQSSVMFGGHAGRAVDGNTDGRWTQNSCTHTQKEDNPWWEVDLGQSRRVKQVRVSNRADCCGFRLDPFDVLVDGQACALGAHIQQGEAVNVVCNGGGVEGRTLKVKTQKTSIMSLCEVQVLAEVGVESDKRGQPPPNDGPPALADEISWGRMQKQDKGGQLKASIEFDPLARIVTRRFFDVSGNFTSSRMPWWDMTDPKTPWCLDLEAIHNAWRVRISGREYPELSFYRNPGSYVTHINTNVNVPHFMLIPAEQVDASVPMSANMINGCQEHPFARTEEIVTFSFLLRPKTMMGNPCVRCEPRPSNQGSHLFFNEGKLVLAVDGAEPRFQTFDRRFRSGLEYRVDVSYNSKDKVVELYLNTQRRGMLGYVKAPKFQLKPGFLGCGSRDKNDGRMFDGQIVDFRVWHTIPHTRPARDRCSSLAGLGVSCPDNQVFEVNAHNIQCQGPVCVASDIDKCCAPRMRCTAYHCPGTARKRRDYGSVVCKGVECHVLECCLPKAMCSSYTCPRGRVLKENPHMISCLKDRCNTADDNDACCDPLGKCGSFACPQGYTHIATANLTHCSDRVCSETDYSRCCGLNGHCSTLRCKQGYVNKAQAAQISCQGKECSAKDHERCCEKRSVCASFVCPEHQVLRKDAPNISCAEQVCSSHDGCCVPKGRCSGLKCPRGWVHAEEAEKIQCDDENCTDTDYRKCCSPQAQCSTYTCPAKFIPKQSIEEIFCTGLECADDLDRDVCCDPLAMCNSTVCPASHVHVHNASSTMCAGAKCSAPDIPNCCTRADVCASLACPKGMVHSPTAHKTHCFGDKCTEQDIGSCCVERAKCSQLTCPAKQVTRGDASNVSCYSHTCKEEDWDLCCVHVGNCLSVQCPAHHVLRPNAKNIMCKSASCDSSDVDVCCDKMALCSAMSCSWGKVLRHNASLVHCSGSTCVEQDAHRCCELSGRCSTLACPADHVHVWGSHARSCADSTCSSLVDTSHCCEKRGFCSSAKCGTSMVLHPNASNMLCQGSHCDDRDTSTCCVPRGNCASYSCPNGTVIRSSPDSIVCRDVHCKQTDWRICCVEVGKCSSMTCQAGRVLRRGAADITCAGGLCGPEDEDVCCTEAAPCSSTACPPSLVLRKAESLLCTSSDCSADQDAAKCCTPKGACSSFRCPQSYILRPNAESLRCADQACVDTEFNVCCAQRETCVSFTCPQQYLPKHQYEKVLCAKDKCTERDRDTCCDRKATCDTIQCPATLLPSFKAKGMQCAGAQCTGEEFSKCCVHKKSCDAVACPAGYVHKDDSHDLECLAEVCTDEDVEQCCTLLSTCDRFECPFGYGSKTMRFSLTSSATTPTPSAAVAFLQDTTDGGGIVHRLCNSLQHFCTRKHRGKRCLEIESAEECSTSYGRLHQEGLAEPWSVLCVWHQSRSVCEAEDFEEALCQLTPTDLGSACHAFACKYEVTVSRPDLENTYSIVVGDGPLRNFKFEGCSAASEAAQSCIRRGLEGVQSLRNNLGEEVATGSCCNDNHLDMVQAVKSECPSMPRKALWNGASWTLQCNKHVCEMEECCEALATCDTMRCPPEHSQVFNARGTFCSGPYCQQSDAEKCCVKLATCKDYACPEDLLLQRDAASLLCSGEACSRSDQEVCCSRPSPCTTMVCPMGFLPKVGAAQIFCWSTPCSEADTELCCDQRASCEHFTLCPHGSTLTTNTSLKCEGTTCKSEDIQTCCDVHIATCALFTCPANYILRENAADISCDSHTCSKVDYHTCCIETPTCSTFTCPPTHSLRAEAEELRCRSEQCGKEEDVDVCCELKDTCEKAECPVEMVRREEASQTPCAGRLCTEADVQTCCVQRASCSNLRCPRDMVLRTPPEGEILCAGRSCAANDSPQCCEMRSLCSEEACSADFVLRAGAMSLFCLGAACTPHVDQDRCCIQKSTCQNFDCPSGYALRAGASFISCDDAQCRQMDFRICCESQAHCDTSECPATHVRRNGAADIACLGSTCGERDITKCCEHKAPCESYKCPVGFRRRPEASELLCRWSTCTDHDLHTCCSEDTTCSSFLCPPEMVRRPHPHQITCSGGDCDDTDVNTCCAKVGTCSSFACPGYMVHKADAHDVVCDGKDCNIGDVHSCCEVPAMCNTATCPPEWEKVDYPEAIPCKHSVCNMSFDLHSCCRQLGRCTCYECPEGYSQKYNSQEIFCTDGDCSSQRTHHSTCCAKEGTCGVYQCPADFTHRMNRLDHTCRDVICRDADKYRCCSRCDERILGG